MRGSTSIHFKAFVRGICWLFVGYFCVRDTCWSVRVLQLVGYVLHFDTQAPWLLEETRLPTGHVLISIFSMGLECPQDPQEAVGTSNT